MIKIEQRENKLVSLQPTAPGTLMERYDLRDFIFNSAKEFFGEIGQHLFVIGKGIHVSKVVPLEIDVLALDRSGQAVMVLLPTTRKQVPFARAITCAGFMSQWKPADFFELISEQQAAELRAFLQVRASEINRKQRAILVAEVFDFEVLTATKWLWEQHGMDHTCVRVFLAEDPESGGEYLGCTDVSNWTSRPLPERQGAPTTRVSGRSELPPVSNGDRLPIASATRRSGELTDDHQAASRVAGSDDWHDVSKQIELP